jgi:hypothetical protein
MEDEIDRLSDKKLKHTNREAWLKKEAAKNKENFSLEYHRKNYKPTEDFKPGQIYSDNINGKTYYYWVDENGKPGRYSTNQTSIERSARLYKNTIRGNQKRYGGIV